MIALLYRVLITCFIALIPFQAAAKWPERVITIISPFDAGGTADFLSRLMSEELQKRLGQSLIVENKTGAGGLIGAAYVARAKPDGYTFLMGSVATHAISPALKKSMPYDSVKDFEPVGLVADLPNLLIVNPSLPVKTITDLIDYAKKAPQPLTYASAGVGTSQHLAAELFIKKAGVKMTHVPYKGAGGIVGAVASGEVNLSFNNFPASWAVAKDGKMARAIAVTSLSRNPAAPDVPTVSETIQGFEAASWFGLFAPKGTDAAIIEQLSGIVKSILEDPAVVAKLKDSGAIAHPLPPAEFSKFVAAETAKWKEVGSSAAITLN